jgi:enterobactin synthetase component D
MEFLSHERPFTLAGAAGVALHACRFDTALLPSASTALPPSLAVAAPRRRAEFLAGRHCAARVLAALDIAPQPIAIGARREPRFPVGIAGSIAHAGGWAVAAAGAASGWRALGVDCEAAVAPDTRDEIAAYVATAAEIALATDVLRDPGRALALVFSIKESAYKALSPWLDGALPDFHDARVRAVDGERIVLALDGALRRALGADALVGRHASLDATTVLTLVALPATRAAGHGLAA